MKSLLRKVWNWSERSDPIAKDLNHDGEDGSECYQSDGQIGSANPKSGYAAAVCDAWPRLAPGATRM